MSQENEIEAKKLSPTTDFLPSDGASCYASLQIKLLDLIGDAERATKAAKTPEDLQACGQMARRLCVALTGF